ncbi:DUF421 domain-containing protein [Amedibacillus dolichus]|uniref:DUF421 domain-containing protein n=1 Tax=Amedibacillus dolichus TaxID=31971 RepID=A0ABT7U9S8_9FIRM|nr:DUF421 domain-containing protein [Amedibacillus dolichus]MDM8156383.1 DUF421 domain-containing protein [Amedibacillus dolichus]
MMEEFASYMELMVKCIIVYFVIIFALRLMGKREVGELSVFDVVIYLVMSELLAISITDTHSSIFRSLVPIAVLALMQIAISWILLKSKRIRDLFDGKAVILIRDGCIDQQMMRKERYSIDDLMSQLHGKDLSSPDEVAFAILENNGTLSILPKKSCRVRYPHPLISDGVIDREVLRSIGKDREWLIQQLGKQGTTAEAVFLCLYQKDGLFVIRRQLH